jgi:hypothetical protein
MLVVAPVARAGGPSTGVGQDLGVLSPDGGTYYFAVGAAGSTVIESVDTDNGLLQKFVVPGSWGVTRVTLNGDAGGISADGKTLVLASMRVRSHSKFLIVDAQTLKPIKTVVLQGSFTFDALSPDGTHLYLIQHTSIKDSNHYVVRSYDLTTNRLLAHRIADKTQQNWVMQGYAMTRTASPGGRWVYTLYQNPGGYPFIHALDTQDGVAHCIGLPWTGNQDKLWNIALKLRGGGTALAVQWKTGRPWLTVNTTNWHITHVPLATVRPPHTAFPWRWVLIGAAAAVLGAFALVLLARRSRPRAKRAPGPTAQSAST